MTREKGPDEIFCPSCGEAIKEEAEICPECGVRRKSEPQSQSTPQHDPSAYETTVSDSWYLGVVAGTVGWVFLLLIASSLPSGENPLMGLVILIVWAILPVSLYFDSKYVRANSKWNPETVLWVIGGIIWVVNIVVGAVYLYRRHEVLGEP